MAELKLTGKTRKIGGEAPAVRIVHEDGSGNVVGMMAAQFQCLITTDCGEALNNLSTILKDEEKIRGVVIMENFDQPFDYPGLGRVADAQGEFAQKYGVQIAEGEMAGKAAPSLFLINPDGEILFMQTGEIDSAAFREALPGLIKEKKKKGHSHENWMRV